VRLPRAELMFWKAALLGAKMVKLGVVLTASVRLVALTAPRKALRPASCAMVLTFGGIVRRLSMMWITPPSNAMSFESVSFDQVDDGRRYLQLQ
jgi:hypothetical protein